MKLVIVRHAHANAHGPDGDFSRKLSDRGHLQAAQSAEFMRATDLSPGYAIVSAAVRTSQTFDDLGLTCPVEYTKRAYNASAGTLLQLAAEAAVEAQCILVVAHNPGVTDLAMSFGYDAVMPPAAVVVAEWIGAVKDVYQSDVNIAASFVSNL